MVTPLGTANISQFVGSRASRGALPGLSPVVYPPNIGRAAVLGLCLHSLGNQHKPYSHKANVARLCYVFFPQHYDRVNSGQVLPMVGRVAGACDLGGNLMLLILGFPIPYEQGREA